MPLVWRRQLRSRVRQDVEPEGPRSSLTQRSAFWRKQLQGIARPTILSDPTHPRSRVRQDVEPQGPRPFPTERSAFWRKQLRSRVRPGASFEHGHHGPNRVLPCSSFYGVCGLFFTGFVRQGLRVPPRTSGQASREAVRSTHAANTPRPCQSNMACFQTACAICSAVIKSRPRNRARRI